MTKRLFISVHVPKTAGTSFKVFLESVFGEQLILDYRSKPLDTNYEARAIANSTEDSLCFQTIAEKLETTDVCVHGHFLPAKYLSIFPDATLISWVREPAQRLMSHYQFWQQNPQPNHSVAKRVVEESLSFKEFCELELMQNINSRFFGDVKIQRYEHIGVTENYEQSLQALCKKFGWEQQSANVLTHKVRVNPLKQASHYSLSDTDSACAERLNHADYALYREVLSQPNS